MSPVRHDVSGPMLSFSLEEELALVRAQLAGSTRSARTLVKEGALRVSLVGLAAGGAIAEHKADGPITVHVLEGDIVLDARNGSHVLGAGMLVALEADIPHAVRSTNGGVFLLTVIAAAGSSSG